MFNKNQEMEAENPSTPPSRLDFLSRNFGKGVKERVANNPTTEIITLQFLADDPIGVWFVVDNPRVPLESLERIAYLSKTGELHSILNIFTDPSIVNSDQQNMLDRLILSNRAMLNMIQRLNRTSSQESKLTATKIYKEKDDSNPRIPEKKILGNIIDIHQPAVKTKSNQIVNLSDFNNWVESNISNSYSPYSDQSFIDYLNNFLRCETPIHLKDILLQLNCSFNTFRLRLTELNLLPHFLTDGSYLYLQDIAGLKEKLGKYNAITKPNPPIIESKLNLEMVDRLTQALVAKDIKNIVGLLKQTDLSLIPNQLRMRLSSICNQKNKLPEALNLLLTCPKEEQTHESFWANLGLIYQKMNRDEEAIDALKQAIILNPNNITYKKILEESNEKIVNKSPIHPISKE